MIHLRHVPVILLLFAANTLFAAPQNTERLERQAQRFIDQMMRLQQRPDTEEAIKTSAFFDEQDHYHVRYQQYVRGVPVLGGEAIVHLKPNGLLETITNDFVDAIDVDPVPHVSPSLAQGLAVDSFGCSTCLNAVPQSSLFAMRLSPQQTGDLGFGEMAVDTLVYQVKLNKIDGSETPSMPVYFIDANTGSVLWSYDNLQTGSVTGTGSSLYSGNVSITTYQQGSSYYLEDVTRKIGTMNLQNTSSSLVRFTDADNVWNSTVQRAGVDAHYGSQAVYDYYLNVLGRTGIDGAGGPGTTTSIDGVTKLVVSKVHYGNNYNNAFWDGQTMTYGDGDGSTFSPLVSIDIAGHEMTHGVTEHSANLVYSGESGALNEAISDIFGAMVERYVYGESANTWKLGEQCYTPGTSGDALRFMDNPHAASNKGFTSDDDPDHYSERYTGSGDNGGVHINSGIANKQFYLLAKGGTHHLGGTMTGIGAEDAAKIWYRALTAYMTSNTNFAGARTATLNAATALFGANSTQYNAVNTAWSMVGVGGIIVVPPGDDYLTNGGFETSVTPWVLSGQAYYTNNGAYPNAGTGYAYLGGGDNNAGAVYQQFNIPSNASTANFTFWLNTISNESTNSTAYDKLFVEVRNSSGTLLTTLATYSNLNKAANGVYSQKGPFNLSAYKGQTIRIHFRATTDYSLPSTFRIDDASVK